MHRTSARPAPLDFRHPTSFATGKKIDHQNILCLSQPLPRRLPASGKGSTKAESPASPTHIMEMGTKYQHPIHNGYTARQELGYLAPTNSSSVYTGSGRHYQAPAPASALRNELQQAKHPFVPSISPHRKGTNALGPAEASQPRKSNNDMIVPNLQIPATINNSGGSLAEFAAQITCLFWFEPMETLNKAERLSSSSSPVQPLHDEALPSTGFRKWVVTILSTTQVTQNVILLALLFIYRLKTINPNVKGRSGSQYRLLTVALMLGNKFLDDNTYTNKTWAEVSGISVTEIHVMEVEFLSNMRYSLLASKEQWLEWQGKLGKFWEYCDAASKASYPQSRPPQSAVSLHGSALPSPPRSLHPSPPVSTSQYAQLASPNYAMPILSPLPSMPALDSRSRKRTYEDEVEEPAAKRAIRTTTQSMASFNPTVVAPMRHEAPRLPVPNLTISTSQAYNAPPYGAPPGFPHHAPQLPPLSGRSMPSAFPTTPTWAPSLPMLTPTGGPPSHHGHGHRNSNGFSTPSRRSPQSVQDLLSLGSSPMSANYQNHNSPSFYLQQRDSPYKPVRHVNTLLHPPPSASMHDHSTNVEQMHYQPLGKRNDYRSGLAYPPHQQWHPLPQPNFHA